MQSNIAPGFGLPLRWQQDNDDDYAWHRHSHNTFLPSALDESEDSDRAPEPLTVPERRMLSLMGELTDTFAWHQKVFDHDFINEWNSEKLAQEGVSQHMVNWCLREVQQHARNYAMSSIIPALERGIFKKDDFVTSTQKEKMCQAISHLERDCSYLLPRSDGITKVVDPYLFPFSFDSSKCLKESKIGREESVQQCGRGQIVGLPGGSEGALKGLGCYANDMAWSLRYQWLPFDISFNEETSSTIIASYINNVHPVRHRAIYEALETFLNNSWPLFDKTLTIIATPSRFWSPRIDVERSGNYDRPNREPGEYQPQEARTRPEYIKPDKNPRPLALRNDFRDTGLQLVLEISNIILTPEFPSKPSTDWHVQGRMNERICATLLYCYSCNNIRGNSISFRHRVSNDEPQFLNAVTFSTVKTEDVYGIKDGEPCVQELGDVAIRENRAICFPNTFQVRINEWRLLDPSCKGHVKYLTLHLVDPHRRIISTIMTPPQQRDWWADELRETVEKFRNLPPEMFINIINMVDDFPISLHDAEIMRDEMLKERTEFQRKQTEAMMQSKFDLMSDARRHEEEMGYHDHLR